MSSRPILVAEPGFVGRKAEIKTLSTCLTSALNRKGIVVFISGEAGTGKTRLVKEFLRSAQEEEVTIIKGWCLGNASVPYFPFIEAFRNYSNRPNNVKKPLPPHKTKREFENATRALLKPTHLKGQEGQEKPSPNVWKDITFVSIGKALQSLSEFQPVIFFIDDIQWADSASLSLLQYISRVLTSERVLVIATYRSEELYWF